MSKTLLSTRGRKETTRQDANSLYSERQGSQAKKKKNENKPVKRERQKKKKKEHKQKKSRQQSTAKVIAKYIYIYKGAHIKRVITTTPLHSHLQTKKKC